MTDFHFINRTVCPACTSSNIHEIYRRPYKDPSLKRSLEEFYAVNGGIEYAYLEDAEFILCQCNACQLVFQTQIPDDFLMLKLYEEWIDPKITFDICVRKNASENYNRLASEATALIAEFQREPHS